jgi:hypothetical protein
VTIRVFPVAIAVCILLTRLALAHDGPPYPILSDVVSGAYRVSLWTDPDATDDGSAGGQFWVRIAPAGNHPLPGSTRARVAVQPLDRPGPRREAATAPVRGDITNQFVALPLDQEGPFAVHVTIDGPLGAAVVDARVEATYDLRPPAYLIAVYLMPFVAVGALWVRFLLRRRETELRTTK